MSRIACIQMTSGAEVNANLASAKDFIQTAVNLGAQLVALPENFALMSGDPLEKIKQSEQFGQGPIQDFLSEQAAQHHIWIVGGTIPITIAEEKKVRAACLVFNDEGKCVARYDKIHLFDVFVRSTQEEHAESSTIQPGQDIVVVPTPFGRLGLAVCYDIRFPELFRKMHKKEVDLIVLPSAFTYPTGLAHWEILIRARAIENLSYLLAPAQTGTHSSGRKTYGHSMIVNPWGVVLAELPEKTGAIVGDIDLGYLHQVRQDFPALSHRII